jgi:hypothetical protein
MQDGGSKLAGHASKWLAYSPKNVVARYVAVWVLLFMAICALLWVGMSARQFRLSRSSRPLRFTNETWLHLDSEQLGTLPHNKETGVWCSMRGELFMRCSFDGVFQHFDFALIGNVDHGYHSYIQCEMFYDNNGNAWVWPTTCIAWLDHYPTSTLLFFATNYAVYLARTYASKTVFVVVASAAVTYILSFAVDFATTFVVLLRKNKWNSRYYHSIFNHGNGGRAGARTGRVGAHLPHSLNARRICHFSVTGRLFCAQKHDPQRAVLAHADSFQ